MVHIQSKAIGNLHGGQQFLTNNEHYIYFLNEEKKTHLKNFETRKANKKGLIRVNLSHSLFDKNSQP